MSAVKRKADIDRAKVKARKLSGERGEDFDPVFVAETAGGEFQLYDPANYLVPYKVRVYANGNVYGVLGRKLTFTQRHMQTIHAELENKQLESAVG